jgi:hypothetical protein
MKQNIVWALLASLASCAGGTETDNPATLKDFSSSSCKSRAGDPGQQALVAESDAEGLQCIEWLTNASGSVTLRLLNFPEPCGDDYQGSANLTQDGTLELAVHKGSCEVFRCGTCVFDFQFEVSSVAQDRALSLRTGSAVCKSEPTTFDDTVSLPIDQQPSGVVCRYLERNAVEQYGRARGNCGERNMPCGSCTGTDTQTCAADLTCTAVADNDSRCLSACTTDDDCTGGTTTCQDGACQANASW